MKEKIDKIIAHILAFILGILPAFFLIFAAIFSDGGSPSEFIMVYALVFIAYAVLGTIFGYFFKKSRIFITLSSSAFIIVTLCTLKELPSHTLRILLHITLPLTALASSCLGVYLGGKIREMRRNNQEVTR
jgi:hypothetical protein